MSKENEKTLTLEERFAHLEQIVARMEDADVSLDEAFELYKKGLDEVRVPMIWYRAWKRPCLC